MLALFLYLVVVILFYLVYFISLLDCCWFIMPHLFAAI